MNGTVHVIAAVAVVWAVALLLAQLMFWCVRRRRNFSRPSGNSFQGILYNFTTGMLPEHKESLRLHPVKFCLGLIMHLGALAAIAKALWLLAVPGATIWLPAATVPALSLAAACGIVLFISRLQTPHLRVMSSPDDYLAVLATILISAAAALQEAAIVPTAVYLMFSAALFFYLPLGKLRHVLFFFVARAEYGGRLGFRGVYPAHPAEGGLHGQR
jgi:hypothetical protein